MGIAEIRELIRDSGIRLKDEGLVAGTWGNISHRAGPDRMAITPSGVPYDELTPEDVALVNVLDMSCEGPRKPSSEAGMHGAIYRAKKEVNAVIHCHSTYAGVVAAIGEEVPPYLEDMAQVIGPTIRVARHALTGAPELAEGVLEALDGRYGALMQNHGAVCIGRDMKEAFAVCHILEKSCRVFVCVRLLGGGKALSVECAESLREFYLNEYWRI